MRLLESCTERRRDGSRRSSGSAFHAIGPATENAGRPSVLRRCRGTTRWWRLEDRSRWRLATSDVGWQQFTRYCNWYFAELLYRGFDLQRGFSFSILQSINWLVYNRISYCTNLYSVHRCPVSTTSRWRNLWRNTDRQSTWRRRCFRAWRKRRWLGRWTSDIGSAELNVNTQTRGTTGHSKPRPIAGCCHLENLTARSQSCWPPMLNVSWRLLQLFSHNYPVTYPVTRKKQTKKQNKTLLYVVTSLQTQAKTSPVTL